MTHPPVLPGLYETPTTVRLETSENVRPDVVDNPVKAERQRLNAAALRVLAFLKSRGDQGALNWELCTPEIGGLRAIGRVDELRRDGWNVQKEHVEKGTWRYTLILPLTL